MQKREIMNISWIRPRSFIITIYCVISSNIVRIKSKIMILCSLQCIGKSKIEQNQDNQEINENSPKGNNKHKDI